jgi:uncharacterized Zn finger protein (UPF0148 family)
VARVVTTELDGFRTCGRPRVVDSASWADDVVLTEDCAHYIESQPCRIVREEVIFTFRDSGAQATNGMDVDMVERSTVRYVPADGNWRCPFCDFETSNFSPEPRQKYMSRSEQSQDELRRRSMRSEETQKAQVTAAERQAIALEALVAQGQESSRVAALERELAELRAQLTNGHDDETPARPRPKAAKA